MRTGLVSALLGAVLVLVGSPAFAHVTVQPEEATAGGFQTFVVQVPNERDDASTIKVEVQFPQSFAFVSFQDVEGWRREVTTVEFDEPIEAFGEEVTEGTGTVTWSGGRIEPSEFETFAFSAGPVPEGDMEFKAIQTYDSGEVVRWIGPADAEQPAAHVTGLDLGLEEGEGELSAMADLRDQVATLQARPASSEADEGSDLGVILGGTALALGVVALVIALSRRPKT